jgi:ankyrin repeat protein
MSEGNQSIDALEEELLGFCRSDSLSEDGLREIIIERYGAPKHQNITNYGFFHVACLKDRVTEGILRLLLDHFPDAASYISGRGKTPLHQMCYNKNATLGMMQLLIDACPGSLRASDDQGWTPLHVLCRNRNLDDLVALNILRSILEKCPGSESVRHTTKKGKLLPLHLAATKKTAEFCRLLIESYPGSERITNCRGNLPLHVACEYNNLDTVKYLLQLYPEGNVADADGFCPIHNAVWGLKDRSNPSDGIEVIQLLRDDNPDALSASGETPLHIAFGHQNELVDLDIVQLLIEAFPDSLRHVDKYRYTPLHDLCENKQLDEDIALDILKLLLEKTPESIRQTSTEGNLPIHLAAETQSLEFCRILIEAYPGSERMTNDNGAFPIHWACQYNTVATVKYLYKLYPESVSVANDGGSKPIHSVIWGLKYREGNPEALLKCRNSSWIAIPTWHRRSLKANSRSIGFVTKQPMTTLQS